MADIFFMRNNGNLSSERGGQSEQGFESWIDTGSFDGGDAALVEARQPTELYLGKSALPAQGT